MKHIFFSNPIVLDLRQHQGSRKPGLTRVTSPFRSAPTLGHLGEELEDTPKVPRGQHLRQTQFRAPDNQAPSLQRTGVLPAQESFAGAPGEAILVPGSL